MTAWLGAVHALQRHLRQNGFREVKLTSVAISCHQFDLQTYKGPNDFVQSIIGTANPLDKKGTRPAFIEEAAIIEESPLPIGLPRAEDFDSGDPDLLSFSEREGTQLLTSRSPARRLLRSLPWKR